MKRLSTLITAAFAMFVNTSAQVKNDGMLSMEEIKKTFLLQSACLTHRSTK